MSTWDDQFQQLKSQFLLRSGERIDNIVALVEHVHAHPHDFNSIREVMKHFHWLAGSGGTYGLDGVSQWGTYGEDLCDYLIKRGTAVELTDVDNFRRACQTIKQIVEESMPAQSVVVNSQITQILPQAEPSMTPPRATNPSPSNPAQVALTQPNPASVMAPVPSIVGAGGTARRGPTNPGQAYVVVADGNANTLGMLKSQCEQKGFFVDALSSSVAVRAALSERIPDAMIVSVPLPDGPGYDLVEYVRNTPEGHRPPVLILSNKADFLDKVQAIRSGADVFFEFPAEQAEVVQKLVNLIDRDKPEQYKILSVEDDPDQANFIKLTLETAGYKLKHISDPKLFEETFLAFEPDLVLLDVMLGDMTGFELAKYIRQHDRFAALPIVFLTTQNKLAMHIRSARVGGDEHLIKPVAPQLLIATVAGRLEKARALKRLIDRDGLTRCLVYGPFMERLSRLASTVGHKTPPALFMIDIDNMASVNQKFGFAAGDRTIAAIGAMLQKGFRNTELICRYGNDQFAIAIENLTEQQLQNLSTQVIQHLASTPHIAQGQTYGITCSGGIAALEAGMTLQDWLAAAEKALQMAKQQGKNRVVVKPFSRAASGGRT